MLNPESRVDLDGLDTVSTGASDDTRQRRQSFAAGRKRLDLSCSYCKRLFRKPEHLKRHENTHSRGKQYTCAVCQRDFGRQDSLKRHEKTHLGQSCNAHTNTDTSPCVNPDQTVLQMGAFPASTIGNIQSDHGCEDDMTVVDVERQATQRVCGVDNLEFPGQASADFPVHHTWPEANDLLEILINADAGWPMDFQVPHIEFNTAPNFSPYDIQQSDGDGSYARARQAMQHMSNLMQDLSFNLAREVEATGVSSDYLENCLATFFQRFVLIFPVVHQPTFSLKDCASPLLLNMIVLGSLFLASNDVNRSQTLWRLAHAAVATSWQSMVNQMRGVDKTMGVQLVMTALLGQTHAVLSQSRSSRMTSHAFHGLGFYWARQCHLPVTQPFTDVPAIDSPPEAKRQKWEAWAAQETRHRALLGHYILDGIISQFSGLPTSDRHVTNNMILPSSAKAYEASSADAWIEAMEAHPQSTTTFCQIYLTLFSPEANLDLSLSPFSIRVVLEGLQSLISDYRQAQGVFVGAPDPKAISNALWRILDTHIESPAHSHDQKLDLLLRWHAICLESYIDTNLAIRHLCHVHSVQQDLYSNSSSIDFDVATWINTRKARCAVLHASAILKLAMDLSLGRMQSIHVPFAVMSSSIVFLTILSHGISGATVPSVVDWRVVCSGEMSSVHSITLSKQLETFLDLSQNSWNVSNGGRSFYYNLNTLQAVLGSLSTTWGIAKDMQSIVKSLTELIV